VEVERRQRRQQERHRQHHAEVEQVHEPVERVTAAIGAAAGVGRDDDLHVLAPSSSRAATYWRSDRSCPYSRSRTSDSPKAAAPTSRPSTVTLNAIRRLLESCSTLPSASPASAGESGISVPMRPSAGPARTRKRVRSSRW